MIRIAFIACAVFAVASADEEASKVLDKLQICNARDNVCLKEAIQKAIPIFAEGIPEIGAVRLDPFLMESETLAWNFGAIRATTVLTDVYNYGKSTHEVLAVRSTPTAGRHRLEIDIYFPRILLEGNYELAGQLASMIKFGGEGWFSVSMQDITTTMDIDGRIEDDRWIVERFIMLPEVQNMTVYFDDLFNGNEVLNEAARDVVNEYWQFFYRAMLPTAARVWGRRITEYLNGIFSQFEYSKMFL